MGFTTAAHPDIPDKVASRVSLALNDNDEITQEAEDTIVSDVLEELLTANVDKDLPPKPTSSAAPSLPGAWGAAPLN